MPFLEEIKKYRSIATIGLEKNVGKTETMNYILKRLKDEGISVGITSIGIDGESLDQVTETAKPEVTVYEGMYFATSEKHFKEKNFLSEIYDVSSATTALGKVVIGKVLEEGKILLSGPSNGSWIKELIEKFYKMGVSLTVVDGALSRLSVGSPIITEGIILSTGAALSLTVDEIIKKTGHIIRILNLPKVEEKKKDILVNFESGIYKGDLNGKNYKRLPIDSLLSFHKLEENIFKDGCSLFITGALTEKFLNNLNKQNLKEKIELIVTDFTKIFASEESVKRFLKKGNEIKVLYKTNLIAITINPVSPTGVVLNSKEIIEGIKKFTDLPVVNLREEKDGR